MFVCVDLGTCGEDHSESLIRYHEVRHKIQKWQATRRSFIFHGHRDCEHFLLHKDIAKKVKERYLCYAPEGVQRPSPGNSQTHPCNRPGPRHRPACCVSPLYELLPHHSTCFDLKTTLGAADACSTLNVYFNYNGAFTKYLMQKHQPKSRNSTGHHTHTHKYTWI